MGDVSLRAYIKAVKKELPFLLRHEKDLPGLSGFNVKNLDGAASARDALEKIARVMPKPWRIVVLLGYVIMYREPEPRAYSSAQGYFSSGGEWVRQIPSTVTDGGLLDDDGAEAEDQEAVGTY